MKVSRVWILLLLLPLLMIPLITTAQQVEFYPDFEQAAEAGSQATPTILVPQDVQRITVQNAKVWWWYVLACAPTEAAEAQAWRVEEISRIATTGGLTRTLYAQEVGSPYCGDWSPEILSNIAADDDHLYWMSNAEDGLVKLPVTANQGDLPSLVYGGQAQADEIEERGSYVYLMDDAYGILEVNKNSGTASSIVTAGQLGGTSRDLQITGNYAYWNQNGFLKVASLLGGGTGIDTGVTGYIAENSLCPPAGPCPNTEYIFVAQGDQIRRYDLATSTFGSVLYDSPITGAVVEEMTVDDDKIYFFERRQAGCNPFCTYDYGLYRVDRTGGNAELLYALTGQIISNQRFDLTLGGPDRDYLFWNDSGALKRLPRDVAAIPSVDLSITHIEVTQSIQDLNNSIDLIQDKRTGVRVHVDANGQNVPGVTAVLYRINNFGLITDGPLYPSSGTNYLTVPDNPDRATFDHAFYFHLPHNWVDDATLRLGAILNPNQIPPEPAFGNNYLSTSTFNMLPSPTLHTHLIVWGYTVNGNYYQPRTVQDVWQAKSWIQRVYPLASIPGGYDSPDPGFRLKVRTINDPNLGGYVMRTSDECLEIPEEDREFCAAGYANNYANWLRGTEGIPDNELIYSMIWDESSLPFPRGFASGNVSAGPTGTGNWGWDYDGSYGDWYMGHEVGHNVGRGHPSQGNFCGHSASDPGFPYAGAAIGSDDMWGFDVGDIGLNAQLPPRVYSNSQWRDMMSYCDNQWISDYTYEGIYNFLTTRQTEPKSTPKPVRAGNNNIAVFGTVYDGADTAVFQLVGLWDTPGPYGPPAGSAYRLRLLDSNGAELAGYDFDGSAEDANPDAYIYEAVVPFPANTIELEIVRNSDSTVLGTHAISANPPAISNVAVANAADPLTGTAALQWQASDADGDDLSFDVYYTDDNGATFTAYALGLDSASINLDTSQMGGSSQARFRVTANDGTRMAEAESPTYNMAYKPPTVTFLTPQDGFEVTYGTAVNFTVAVEDLQGHIDDADIDWFLNGNRLRGNNGPYYTAYLLPVGTNTISARAQNGAGQMTTKSITVIVNDDLAYPGPSLAVGPDQVSWQVAASTATPQQATLTVSNIGTGNLNWTASENADWLTLSAGSGAAPGTITLTADPTMVTENVPADTIVTISGDNGQSLQVPVKLLVGITPPWGDPDSLFELFLPLVLRQ